jgi:chaperonin GroEL
MQRGINKMANAIRPTLGPLPRVVAIERSLRHRTPELLDDGGTIARRIIELPNRDEDMGAMFLRHVVQHVYDQAGDGTATAAVLLQSAYNQGIRYLAAGGNAMRLRDYLQQGTWTILSELNKMMVRVQGEAQLAQLAEAICHDPPLAKLIGEIFDIIGEYGRLEVQVGNSLNLEREYVEGLYWPSSLHSREMMTDFKKLRTDLSDVALLMTNCDFEDATQLVPALTTVRQANIPALVVVANKLSGEAIALLLANSKSDAFKAIAVKTPGLGATKQTEALLDLAKLAGGRIFIKNLDESGLENVQLSHLGRVRRAWADKNYFGIISGKGNPKELRRHIAELRAAYQRAEDMEQRQEIRERLGKLISGSAMLKIGGGANAEIKARKENAERTCEAVRGAMVEGVLPGGGVALLACRPALQQKLEQTTNPDERAAYQILFNAVEEPLRVIAANAGYEPSQVLGQVQQGGPGCGFDVRCGQVVNVFEAGIFDSARALKTAAQSAFASAALALTTEVLVHHKKPRPPAMAGPGPNWDRTVTHG